ncbi:MAG: hypothetical protein ACKVII_00815 [Planctomycetales bacterium]|jgi:hypothetical protein
MKQTALPILVLLVVVTLAVVTTLPSASVEADHYQRFRDGKSLYTLLSGSIGRGNSLQHVEELLGRGIPLEEDVETFRESLRETAQSEPDSYPDGIYEADTFMAWSGSDEKVTLQFRNGHLVNFSPEQFTTFRPSYDLAGQAEQYDESAMESGIAIAGREFASAPLVQTKPTSTDSTEE